MADIVNGNINNVSGLAGATNGESKMGGDIAASGGIGGAGIGFGTGLRGRSAYESALIQGFVGTEKEWIDSLHGKDGAQGDKGDKGDKGDQGAKGDSYILTDADKAEMVQAVIAALPNAEGVGF